MKRPLELDVRKDLLEFEDVELINNSISAQTLM